MALWLVLLIYGNIGYSQDCNIVLSGYVEDADAHDALEVVNLYIEELGDGAVTNHDGYFEIKDLCPGSYHIVTSHIGCTPKRLFIKLRRDTSIVIHMDHSATLLNSVVVHGQSNADNTQNSATFSKQEISDNADENLANMLEAIVGVSAIKNGSEIAKPVVHGLYGNRLTILNNGVAQSGQQWGNDHSPEIDPLVANKIRVIKGTSALEYLGGNLGSVILVEPQKIALEPHLHGKASYFFESNGRGHGLNVQLQQYAPSIAWKVNGTFKRSGDKKTADYYLNNTGGQEANFAIQLEKKVNDKFFLDFYGSTFNTELGIMRGALIGNIPDLNKALEREVPLYTEEEFSYDIDAPRQKVNHHLGKVRAQYFLKDSEWFDFTIATQWNDRKEFDIRRGDRTKIPALSLQQLSIFTEGKYQKEVDAWSLKAGIQNNIIDNTNNPETGILPLIPDYLSYESGLYFGLNRKWGETHADFGARYDYAYQSVAAFSQTGKIERYLNQFHNFNAATGIAHSLSEHHNLTANIGFAMRNPGINELYSAGLHQGVSGIEEGDPSLNTEKAVKATLEYSADTHSALTFEGLVYYQYLQDYIFLNPQDEIRLTIRGAFPVFKYEQTDASIFGIDLASRWSISHQLYTDIRYSFLRGNDISKDLPLVFMPSNNIEVNLGYQVEKRIKWNSIQLENISFLINNRYVFRQNHLLAFQDFKEAPDAYYLLGLNISGDLQIKKTRLRLVSKVSNLLNVKYRDYLNRQRYFADALGINASFGISVDF